MNPVEPVVAARCLFWWAHQSEQQRTSGEKDVYDVQGGLVSFISGIYLWEDSQYK